jgi:hypothetical protein
MSKFVEFCTKSYCFEVLHLTIYESRKKTKEMCEDDSFTFSADETLKTQNTRLYEIKLFLTSWRSQIHQDQFCPTEWDHQGPFWPP